MCAQRTVEPVHTGTGQESASFLARIPKPERRATDSHSAAAILRETGIRAPAILRVVPSAQEAARVRGTLGEQEAARLLGEHPPCVVEVSQETYNALIRNAHLVGGAYLPGSNLIVLPPGKANEAQGTEVIMHEITHYAGYLGRGINIRYASGQQEFNGFIPNWLEEGLANSISSYLAGRTDASLPYPWETKACIFLERIARGPNLERSAEEGARIVRDAFASGDFRPLSALVDARGGAGTFERMLRADNGCEAYALLTSAIPDSRFEIEFARDPRGRRANQAVIRSSP